MHGFLLEAASSGIPESSWITGLLAGGGTSTIMGFIIWRVFTHMIPAFTVAIEKQRADSIAALEKQRLFDREENQVARREFLSALDRLQAHYREDLAKERRERQNAMERVLISLNEQTALLTKLTLSADNDVP